MPDKLFTKDRLWVEIGDDGLAKIGLTARAAAGFGEIAAAVLPEPGKNLAKGEACVTLRTALGETAVEAPFSGTIAAANPALAEGIAALNETPETVWLFSMRLADPTAFADLMDRAAYEARG